MDSRKCQTATASPAEPGELPVGLARFGAPLSGLTPEDFRDGEFWFQMGFAPARFDVLQRIDSMDFEEAWQTRVPYEMDGIPVNVISRELLIRNKSAVGRPRDIADVIDLQKANDSTADTSGSKP